MSPFIFVLFIYNIDIQGSHWVKASEVLQVRVGNRLRLSVGLQRGARANDGCQRTLKWKGCP